MFDNIYIGHDINAARDFAAKTFDVRRPLEEAIDRKERLSEVRANVGA